MTRNPDDRDGPRPPKKLIWIAAGVIIVLIALFAIQGIVRGTGEAVGITEAAPGDDDANPAAEERPTAKDMQVRPPMGSAS